MTNENGSSLNDQILATAKRMREARDVDGAQVLDDSAAYMREAWRGADDHGELTENLQVIIDNATAVRDAVLRHTRLYES